VVVESFTVPTQPEVVSPKALFRQTYQVKAVQTAAQPEEKFTPPDPPASTRPATVR